MLIILLNSFLFIGFPTTVHQKAVSDTNEKSRYYTSDFEHVAVTYFVGETVKKDWLSGVVASACSCIWCNVFYTFICFTTRSLYTLWDVSKSLINT